MSRFSIPIILASLGHGFHVVPAEEFEREPSAELPPIDYAPLKNAAREISLWLLDVARSRTTEPIDRTAIERVHRALVVAFASNGPTSARPDVSEQDLLTVAGILITAFEADLGVDGLSTAAGSAYDAERERVTGLDESMAAQLVAAMAPKRGLVRQIVRIVPFVRQIVRIVPFAVGRRPRVVDEDALDDVAFR